MHPNKKVSNKSNPSKKIAFNCNAPAANSVAVAGSFNDWDPNKAPMQKLQNGLWKTSIALPTGRHEYRFVVDGQWISDPNALKSASNPYGGTNSVIVV